MAYIYDIADTWSASGTTFTGIKLNVTDTASAAGSLLMDLQVGGVSQFSVNKSTGISFRLGAKAVTFNNDYGLQLSTGSSLAFAVGSANSAIMTLGQWTVDRLGFGISTGSVTLLQQDGNTPHTLAQRNGVNAQAFNLYNSYTDGSNFERGFMRWVSNVLRIGTEKLGTGTARALEFQVDGTTRLSINTGGSVIVGAALYGASGSTYIGWTNNALMTSPSVGVIRLNNFAETDFNRLQFGGTTSSFPSIKRSTTSLQARLADDSAFTNIQGKLTTDTAYTAGAPTATGYIVLFDSAGTAYKVPVEAL